MPKELLSNSVRLVHLEAQLLVSASKRDFPLKNSANSTFHYIRNPQSYRTALLQASHATYSLFADSYATMYRLQLSIKRVPDYIKTILKLITQGSPMMIEKMLPSTLNNMVRTVDELPASIRKNLDQLADLTRLFDEIRASLPTLSITARDQPSDRTELAQSDRFNSTTALDEISVLLEQMRGHLEQFTELILGMNVRAAFNFISPVQTACLVSILHTLESTAHLLYQSASLYAYALKQHVVDRSAGLGKFLSLSTDDERSATLLALGQQWSSALHELQQLWAERQSELQLGDRLLHQAYDKLFETFPYETCKTTNK